MRNTDLRYVAARYYLGVVTTKHLVDVAHAVLDSGIYAYGLGEIATNHAPVLAEVSPLFESALKELGVEISSWEQAIDLLAQFYMVALAEGAYTRREVCSMVDSDYTTLFLDGRSRRGEGKSFGPLSRIRELVYDYEIAVALGGDPAQVDLQLDLQGINLARTWCHNRWRSAFQPEWFTATVMSLAEGIDRDRAFDRLPILADALQDAGCDNADILDHCRDAGPHVRGCWVVDLLTGKE
jgi:hypothetical protein